MHRLLPIKQSSKRLANVLRKRTSFFLEVRWTELNVSDVSVFLKTCVLRTGSTYPANTSCWIVIASGHNLQEWTRILTVILEGFLWVFLYFPKTHKIHDTPSKNTWNDFRLWRANTPCPNRIIAPPRKTTRLKAAAKKSGSWSFSGGSELFARAEVEKLNVMHL